MVQRIIKHQPHQSQCLSTWHLSQPPSALPDGIMSRSHLLGVLLGQRGLVRDPAAIVINHLDSWHWWSQFMASQGTSHHSCYKWVWVKINHQGTAGFGSCSHLLGFHLGYLFLTHSQMAPSSLQETSGCHRPSRAQKCGFQPDSVASERRPQSL